MIEQTLHALISSDERFVSVADDRLSPGLLSEQSSLPAATYQVISKRYLYALDGRIDLTKARIQIDTWAKTYAQAKALAAAITAILDDSTLDAQLLSSTDLYEHEAQLYRVMTEFSVSYSS